MKQGWKVKIFEWGSFALDGGAMFGVVPKVLWSKLISPDEQNRIPLSLRSLYLEKGDMKVLVDLGMGFDWEAKAKKIYSLETSPAEVILQNKLQLKALDITHVVLTHLHFDHCGFLATQRGADFESTFPNAEIFVCEENFKNAQAPSSRESASYLQHIWTPAQKKKQITQISCEWMEHREILPGIYYRRVDGHTVGQTMVYVSGQDADYIFPADLCPTENHLKEIYVMGYDLNAGLSVKEKKQFLAEEKTRNSRIVFEHSSKVPFIEGSSLS